MSSKNKTSNQIRCEAKFCEYHTDDNKCNADQILVTPYDSVNSKETRCETFIPKEFIMD